MLLIVFVVMLISGIGAFWGAKKRRLRHKELEDSVVDVHHQWVDAMAQEPFDERLSRACEEVQLRGWSAFGGDILKAQTDAELLAGIEAVRTVLLAQEPAARWFGLASALRSQLHAFYSIGGLGDIAASIKSSEPVAGTMESVAGDAWAAPEARD